MFLLIFFSNNEIIIFVTQSSVSFLRSAVLKPKEGSSNDRMLGQVLGAK